MSSKHITPERERELYIGAGLDPASLGASASTPLHTSRGVAESPTPQDIVTVTPQLETYLHNRRVRQWEHCQQYVYLNGCAYRVDIDHDADSGSSVRVFRYMETGLNHTKSAECPNCGSTGDNGADDTDFYVARDGDSQTEMLKCNGCDFEVAIASGVPEEYREMK